jgi:hypothetical protein
MTIFLNGAILSSFSREEPVFASFPEACRG